MTSSSSSSSLSSSFLAWRQTLCSLICPVSCTAESYQRRRPQQYQPHHQQQRQFVHNRKSSTKLIGSATVIRYVLTSVIVLAIGLSLFASWKVTSRRQQELVAVAVPPSNSNIRQQPHLQRAVFYNIFVAPTDPLRQIGLDIVESQLQLLRRRFYHLLQKEQQLTAATVLPTVYFTLIGSHQNTTMDIQSICRRLSLDCHQTQYLEQGDEGATLDALYDYCQQHPYPETTLVTYLHNKGSWHPSEDNTKLRALQTKAVFSNECQTLMTTASEKHVNYPPRCNICSARFSLMPHYHMPGNMFTARCDYVNGLIKPSVFPDQMQQLIDHVQEVAATAKKTGKKKDEHGLRPISLHDLFLNKFPYRVGLGRYAFEHWIASGPDVRPCDVFDGPYRLAYENLPPPTDRWIPHLQEAGWIPQSKFRVPGHTHQWYCGRGRLLEFQYLYGRLPPPESFVWKLYGKPTRACPHPVRPPPHTQDVALSPE